MNHSRHSHAHREAVRLLTAGYRLAFDKLATPRLNLSGWWLTRGEGPLVHVATSVARRLIELGVVREVLADDDVVYYELAQEARAVA